MAITARQKQKKLEQKKRKRKIAKQGITAHLTKLSGKSENYTEYPVHECLIPNSLFEMGIGEIIFTRKVPDGNIAVSAFVLDVFCLGVKNALFKVMSEYQYEHDFKENLYQKIEGSGFEKVHPACAKKLVEGGISYAKALGFSPHKDYKAAKGLLDKVDHTVCPVKYTYGKDGKPLYIQGPHENEAKIIEIMDKLHTKCGEGGYDYMLSFGDELFDSEFRE